MSLPDQAASIWVNRTRVTALSEEGAIAPGANSYVTESIVKATVTPVAEAGDAPAIKNAAGNLSAWGKHGDMVKYYTVNLELATPDPGLIQMLNGGVLYTSSASALGAPTGLTVTNEPKLLSVGKNGKLAASTFYGYRVTQYNQYGESVAEADVNAESGSGTATEQAMILSGVTTAAGAVGVKIYGRTIGQEQYIGSYRIIGTAQETEAASGTGTVVKLKVKALTVSIPIGTQFILSGDTNTEKIVFETTAFAPEGAVELKVKTLNSTVTTTIATKAKLEQVFADYGQVTPSGFVPATDTSAGFGEYGGYQAPALGSVANQNGVSLEFFEEAITGGYQATLYPYYRHVLPRVTQFHPMPKDFTNANLQSIQEGEAFQNPNWGSGPQLDWQFDSTKVYQYARCGSQIVPAVGLTPVAAI
jgi:hypothetical protein